MASIRFLTLRWLDDCQFVSRAAPGSERTLEVLFVGNDELIFFLSLVVVGKNFTYFILNKPRPDRGMLVFAIQKGSHWVLMSMASLIWSVFDLISVCAGASQQLWVGGLTLVLDDGSGLGHLALYSHFRCYLRQFHLHLEHESRAFVDTIRVNINLSATIVNNFLTYSQTHSNSIGIWFFSALQFSEQSEQIIELIFRNTFSCILHMHL